MPRRTRQQKAIQMARRLSRDIRAGRAISSRRINRLGRLDTVAGTLATNLLNFLATKGGD